MKIMSADFIEPLTLPLVSPSVQTDGAQKIDVDYISDPVASQRCII